jgi:dephospho-CoA kinase
MTMGRLRRRVRVLGFTGMPGAGKSEAVAVARGRGIPVVRMGDLVWEEVDRQGLPRDARTVGRVADAMRKAAGDDVWAVRTLERLRRDHAAAPTVVVDGVRSNAEVEAFRRELADDFTLVAIHTQRHARFARMTRRARDDDPDDDDEHVKRDERELGWGLARTIALADVMIVNAGSLPDFRRRVRRVLDGTVA